MNPYERKKVLVTGGLGFIGSNLAIRLVELGAKVTIVDSLAAGCGGNLCNIGPIADEIELAVADIGEARQVRPLLKNMDVIFNLAGEVSHIHSVEFPERDLELNTRSQLTFLQECAREAEGARVVYTCTRQVYGKPQYLPVDEEHPIVPVDVNGVNKHAAGLYHLMMSNTGRLDAAVVRLTNVYGPRLALNVPCQGVLSAFFRKILTAKPIELYGDGSQFRDPLYVDDAVDALLKTGAAARLPSRVYNVGGLQRLSLAEMAGMLCREAGASPPTCRPFPSELARIDIGSFQADWRRIERELGWRPEVTFEVGAARTLDFFRAHWAEYFPVSGSVPACVLRQAVAQTAGRCA